MSDFTGYYAMPSNDYRFLGTDFQMPKDPPPVCNKCEKTADREPIYSGWSEGPGRFVKVTVYACQEHWDELSNALCDETGHAGNYETQPPRFVRHDGLTSTGDPMPAAGAPCPRCSNPWPLDQRR